MNKIRDPVVESSKKRKREDTTEDAELDEELSKLTKEVQEFGLSNIQNRFIQINKQNI